MSSRWRPSGVSFPPGLCQPSRCSSCPSPTIIFSSLCPHRWRCTGCWSSSVRRPEAITCGSCGSCGSCSSAGDGSGEGGVCSVQRSRLLHQAGPRSFLVVNSGMLTRSGLLHLLPDALLLLSLELDKNRNLVGPVLLDTISSV